MFLNRDFCMEKLLAREVTIFPEKNKSSKILSEIQKNQHQIVRKTYQGLNVWINLTYLSESKVKDFLIISLAYAKSPFKNILDI